MRGPLAAACLACLAAGGAQADATAYPALDPALAQGRAVWLENCEGCHGYGIAGAPIPMEADDWRERLRQDRGVLYRHAIEGFFGPDDTFMPPRGGNERLGDDEVRAAVDYMAALARSHIQQTEHTR
jgi:cytochrome c5